MPDHGLPIIDISDADRAPSQILDACRNVGFFYITGHGVHPDTIRDTREAAADFFAQPVEIKDAVRAIDHRGYIGVGSAKMEGAARPDVKESFVVGHEPKPEEVGQPLRGANQWPQTPASFRPAVERYLAEVAAAARTVLRFVARSLDVAEDFFDERYESPLMRTNIIRYPPVGEERADEFGVAEHTDFGCLTLLWQDEVGGLEVRNLATGEYMPAAPVPDTFVVNVGDLLERWSNGRFTSTLHRVVNRSGRERFSIATFFDPSYDAVADPLDLKPGAEAAYEPVVSGDYILGRIKRAFDYQPADA